MTHACPEADGPDTAGWGSMSAIALLMASPDRMEQSEALELVQQLPYDWRRGVACLEQLSGEEERMMRRFKTELKDEEVYCGVLVQALESEYEEVRLEAVRVVRHVVKQSNKDTRIINGAIACLFDSLVDSSVDVVAACIHSLQEILQHNKELLISRLDLDTLLQCVSSNNTSMASNAASLLLIVLDSTTGVFDVKLIQTILTASATALEHSSFTRINTSVLYRVPYLLPVHLPPPSLLQSWLSNRISPSHTDPITALELLLALLANAFPPIVSSLSEPRKQRLAVIRATYPECSPDKEQSASRRAS